MTKPHNDDRGAGPNASVQSGDQKQKMDQASQKHAGKTKGNTEPNAGGENREAGDCKARTKDRTTNGGE